MRTTAPDLEEAPVELARVARNEAPTVAAVPRTAASVLALQRSAGNRATTAVLARCGCGCAGSGGCNTHGALEEEALLGRRM